jgi:hypothetical protein
LDVVITLNINKNLTDYFGVCPKPPLNNDPSITGVYNVGNTKNIEQSMHI